ncbi:hypothetical protein MTR_8g066000 [Medicago truncatula]|uniref:Uncharacterized protein n=1 Tax=Medicago truncatula TaxID=3880 RepID=G7LG82_MEDTR|nr:hypothetical protein MTR_8g066000 [Medicago truncatula]
MAICRFNATNASPSIYRKQGTIIFSKKKLYEFFGSINKNAFWVTEARVAGSELAKVDEVA